MKPVRLVLRAVGPYAEETVLDFRELRGRNFFLITGPTGAGKTTLFDAMAFALFGETAGKDRDPRDIRSDQAAPERRTEVVFDFLIGPELYRVRRSPRQLRPAKKGPGLVEELPKSDFWKRTGLTDDAAEGEVLASGWNEVTAQVEERMGFSADQFRQVVLLPQGQFRRFLSANSMDREKILEALFRTETYRRIEDALKGNADRLKAEAAELAVQESTTLQREGAATREELEARKTADEGRAAERSAQAESFRKREEELQRAIAERREIARKIAERDEARAERAAIDSGLAANDDRRRIAVQARKALPLVDREKDVRQRNREAEEAARALRLSTSSLDAAKTRLGEALQARAAEQAREPDRRRAAEALRSLEEVKGRMAELAELRREATLRIGRATEARGAVHTAEAALRAARAEAGRKKDALIEAQALAPQVVSLQGMVDDVKRRREARRKLDRERAQMGELRDSETQSRAVVAAQEGRIAERRAAVEALDTSWIRGQAALLAWSLKEGEPCTVCGSTSHPAPAKTLGRLPDEAELQLAKAGLREMEGRLKTAQGAAARAGEALRAGEASILSLEGALGDDAGAELDVLAGREEELLARLDRASAAGVELPRLARDLAALGKAEEQAQAFLDATRTAAEQAQAEVEKAEALRRDREAAQRTGLGEPREVELAIAKAKAASEALGALLKSREEEARAAELAFSGAQATVEGNRTAARDAEERAKTAAAEFAAKLLAAGFDSGREFEAARRPEEEIAAIETEVGAFDARLQAAGGRLRRAEEAAKGLDPQPLEPLLEELGRVQSEKDRALGEAAAARRDAERRAEAVAEAARLAARRGEIEREFAILGRLSQVANGQNPQRLTLQRFVLRSLLQEVLAVATRRLAGMSRGRYALQVVRPGGEVRSTGGLELEVQDAWTGSARSVATLSGGEGFLASLALALGLADVVQSRAGGIRLDTIFVDEGFGTLDEEALDLAIDTLMGLRDRGRLVGIISHVRELRERIDARLEVAAGRGSSTARFVLA